jgi:hypothetical protein
MANFKGHLIGGLVAYLLIVSIMGFAQISAIKHLQWLGATLAGSIFPDIDVYSKGQRLFLKILGILVLLCLLLKAFIPLIMILVLAILPVVLPHRSLFHDLFFLAFLIGVSALFLVAVMPENSHVIITSSLFFMLGVFSHLLLDKGLKGTIKNK